jgi:SAM-dependent methyltransferase
MHFKPQQKILEIGCGTGALLEELGQHSFKLYGLEKDPQRVIEATQNLKATKIESQIAQGNIESAPYENRTFESILSHFVFLWIHDLQKAFEECARILKPHGFLALFGEPDYEGLIEFPDTGLKNAIIQNLHAEGANPLVARELSKSFSPFFQVVQWIVPSIPWVTPTASKDLYQEYEFLTQILGSNDWHPELMYQAINNDQYFLYIPIFCVLLQKLEEGYFKKL